MGGNWPKQGGDENGWAHLGYLLMIGLGDVRWRNLIGDKGRCCQSVSAPGLDGWNDDAMRVKPGCSATWLEKCAKVILSWLLPYSTLPGDSRFIELVPSD